MQAPLQAIGMLDPTLREVGFGIFRVGDGRIQTAAGLDIPRHPLEPGRSYRVHLVVTGRVVDWSFRVDAALPAS